MPVVPNFLRKQDMPYRAIKVNITLPAPGPSTHWPPNTTLCLPGPPARDQRDGASVTLQTVTEYYVASPVTPYLCYNDSQEGGGGTVVTVTEEVPRSAQLGNEDVKVGVLFASKAIVQLLANPFMGPLTNRLVATVTVCSLWRVGRWRVGGAVAMVWVRA